MECASRRHRTRDGRRTSQLEPALVVDDLQPALLAEAIERIGETRGGNVEAPAGALVLCVCANPRQCEHCACQCRHEYAAGQGHGCR